MKAVQLSKKSLLIIIIGTILIAGAIFYLVWSQRGTKSTETGQSGSVGTISGALEDLGTLSQEKQLNIKTDSNIIAGNLKNTKIRDALVSQYGSTPELLLTTKNFLSELEKKLGGEIYNSPQTKFSFALSEKAGQAVQSDESKKIAGQTTPIFEYETNIGEEYLSKLEKSLGLEEKSKETDPATGEIIVANFDPNQSSQSNTALKTLIINPLTGAFRYYSSTGESASESVEPIQKAQNFLLNNSVLSTYTKNIDFTQTATYELKDAPGIEFVEFHRGWRPLPIINSISIFNLQKLGKNILETIKDPLNKNALVKDSDVTSASDGLDGYLRPDDFNTIAVGVSERGIVTVSGAMRPLKNNAGELKLISPAAAFENIKSGQYYQTMLLTAGEGTADPKKVYPNDLAESDKAVVDTIYLTYIEEPTDKKQNYLQPVYVMRGSARLKSGYNVLFSLVTPAYEKSVKTSSLLEVNAAVETENIKIDFLKLKVEDAESQGTNQSTTPTTSSGVGPNQYNNMPASQIPESESCRRIFADIVVVDSLTLARTRTDPNDPLSGRAIWQLTPQTEISIAKKDGNIALAATDSTKTSTIWKYAQAIGRASSKDIGSFITSTGGVGSNCVTCNLGSTPCTGRYYSGVSPLLYIYGRNQEFALIPHSTGKITYSDPPLLNRWTLTAATTPKPYYYEFTYKNLKVPSEGFVASKDASLNFLKNYLLPRLSLTSSEIEDYLTDIKTHVLSQTPADKKYYKISLIEKAEIERVLPLEVTPKPASQIRNLLHFESLEKPESATRPKLPDKINRVQFETLLVENGCLLDENGKRD